MKPTLLVLAAGMGSRYGKLKQMDGFGPNGETIIEYSIYDAIKAGFGKVVFIIRDFFKEDFEAYFRPRLEGKIELAFVSQEIENIPADYTIHPERERPWGTAHAIWVAKDVIHEPFGVINADDYYGVDAYSKLAAFLTDSGNVQGDYAVVAYYLKNTLSEHGTVNRGVCIADDQGYLTGVKECIKIKRDDDGMIRYPQDDGTFTTLAENTLVSMNMWGFLPSYFGYAEKLFRQFLEESGMELKSEFFIPILIDYLIQQKILKVRVIDTDSDWFGVTYQEDKPYVMQRITALIEKQVYPQKLWE
ncbi:MAG: nucleotidyltransferase [Saprospiraceae bacterium]|nr:nucleotidyltransferase [Saprospiraceae bacterium]